MTVENSTRFVVLDGDSSNATWSFSPIVIFDDTDIVVTIYDPSGNPTSITQGSAAGDFTVVVSGDYPQTGSVTYPNSGTALPTGWQIKIERVLEDTQPLSLEPEGGYSSTDTEEELDRLTMLIIQHAGDLAVNKILLTLLAQTLGLTLTINVDESGGAIGGSLTGYASTLVDTQWQKRVTGAIPITLTDGSSVPWDMSQGNTFDWTCAGASHTLAAASNLRNGDSGYLYIIGDGTHTPLIDSSYNLVGFSTANFNIGSGKKNYCGYSVYGGVVNLFLNGTD